MFHSSFSSFSLFINVIKIKQGCNVKMFYSLFLFFFYRMFLSIPASLFNIFLFSCFSVSGLYPSGFDYMAPPPPYPGPPQNWNPPPQTWPSAPAPPPGLFFLIYFPHSICLFSLFLPLSSLCMSVSLHMSNVISSLR